MNKYIAGLLGAVFLLLSCAQEQYGGAPSGGPAPAGPTGYNPSNHTSKLSPTNSGNCQNIQGGNWGGITCLSNSDRDSGFLGFLSITVDVSERETRGISRISCNPSQSGGILFQLKVALNAPFDPAGNNSNLAMQIASSKLEMVIYDLSVEKQNLEPLAAVYDGLRGNVNGNQGSFTFNLIHQKGGLQEITLDGRFIKDRECGECFVGTASFTNDRDWNNRKPGASGTLGNFKIPTCPIFQ